MNNIRTHTHRTSKKNICYREREGEHAHIHARGFVRSALFLSEQRATSERREEKEGDEEEGEKKRKKREAAIVTRASNQASERCRLFCTGRGNRVTRLRIE